MDKWKRVLLLCLLSGFGLIGIGLWANFVAETAMTEALEPVRELG